MDCMDAMREFPDNFFELAIVDPPYGINIGSAPGGATSKSFHSVEEETHDSNRRRNSVRKQIRVGGVSLSHPKPTRHSMIATHRMSHISLNWSGWQRIRLYGEATTSLTI